MKSGKPHGPIPIKKKLKCFSGLSNVIIDKYDLVAEIDWFSNLRKGDEGWKIFSESGSDLLKKEDTLCVAVLGMKCQM